MAKILIVEDDPAIGAIFSEILTDQRYIVNLAADGQQGLELASSINYDLILLDRILPGLDGIEVCRQLRAQGNQTPILLMTGQVGDLDVVAGLDAGADDCLPKPCDISELLARVRALLRRGEAVVPPVLIWERLCLNPISAHVTYDGHPLALTAKEYGLLELFLRHPQRIFSRTVILDRLWRFDSAPNETVVTNHIKELRQKLKTAGMSNSPIETVYGLGYRLKPAPQTQAETQEHSGAKSSESPRDHSAQAGSSHPDLEQTERSAQAGRRRDDAEARVLVVAQDPTILAALNYLLTPWGIEITELNALERFQEILSVTQPDLLILDLHVSNSSGINLCQTVRQDAQWDDLPILVITAQTNTAAIQQVFAAGADDFVGKPIVGPELVTRVISRLERVRTQHRLAKLEQKQSPANMPESFSTDLSPSQHPHTHTSLLLVDDQLDNLRSLSAILKGQGFRVRQAISGEMALETIHSQPPDLILLDIRMPNMDGYEVCATLKADENTRDIPIVFLSALDDTTDKIKAFAVGGADYITKPFQAEEVLTRIKHQLVIRQQQQQLIEQNYQLQQEIQERQRSNVALYRAQTVLQESEDRFRNAFDHASIGMALIGLDSRWLKVNSALCQMLGYSESELLALTVSDCLSAEDAARYAACLQSMLDYKLQNCQIELQCRCKSNPLIPVLMGISLVQNAQNQPVYYLAQLQDMSERR
jgi:PAS domain S-box-containing protein